MRTRTTKERETFVGTAKSPFQSKKSFFFIAFVVEIRSSIDQSIGWWIIPLFLSIETTATQQLSSDSPRPPSALKFKARDKFRATIDRRVVDTTARITCSLPRSIDRSINFLHRCPRYHRTRRLLLLLPSYTSLLFTAFLSYRTKRFSQIFIPLFASFRRFPVPFGKFHPRSGSRYPRDRQLPSTLDPPPVRRISFLQIRLQTLDDCYVGF